MIPTKRAISGPTDADFFGAAFDPAAEALALAAAEKTVPVKVSPLTVMSTVAPTVKLAASVVVATAEAGANGVGKEPFLGPQPFGSIGRAKLTAAPFMSLVNVV